MCTHSRCCVELLSNLTLVCRACACPCADSVHEGAGLKGSRANKLHLMIHLLSLQVVYTVLRESCRHRCASRQHMLLLKPNPLSSASVLCMLPWFLLQGWWCPTLRKPCRHLRSSQAACGTMWSFTSSRGRSSKQQGLPWGLSAALLVRRGSVSVWREFRTMEVGEGAVGACRGASTHTN